MDNIHRGQIGRLVPSLVVKAHKYVQGPLFNGYSRFHVANTSMSHLDHVQIHCRPTVADIVLDHLSN
jgi:hypothetical protein